MELTKLIIIFEFCALFLFNSVYANEFEVVDTKETHFAVALEKAPRVLVVKDKASKLIDEDLKKKANLRKNNET